MEYPNLMDIGHRFGHGIIIHMEGRVSMRLSTDLEIMKRMDNCMDNNHMDSHHMENRIRHTNRNRHRVANWYVSSRVN